MYTCTHRQLLLCLTSTFLYTCFDGGFRAPGMDPLRVPLATAVQSRVVGHASVWAWAGVALDEGSDAAEWFTKYLGKPCKLVRFDTGKFECFQIFISIEQYNGLRINVSFYNSAESQIRPTNPAYASDFKICFPDGYPFLVISQVRVLQVSMSIGLTIAFSSTWRLIALYLFSFPFQASLDALNEKLDSPVSINRFRPKYKRFYVYEKYTL